ncbi:putative DNA methyltransferase [Neospora caninum Liverpool]|uniref:tRNA (cytosine(38)-C(5))-methyltransferase n=1 Tax=Neospora caninum (strain Liverpool) TaxID=572307 RepID=F0VE99_NEOCL|nr:putative DNA methyltransferase [Neospora caninum Liverpool]CBZ52043.1 putative DNA methyltransferase [Neospora caninum Liverpool]CEL66004.1 TPA: DNA methyltransferase, putative [Neospora caninum Liverpool]|eukprot:XP_003882075.1 putative DNA methyltransferase [Neospora caninum Liverpool]
MTLKALILYSGIGGMHCGLFHARLLRRLRMRGVSPFPPRSSEEHEQETNRDASAHGESAARQRTDPVPATDREVTRHETQEELESKHSVEGKAGGSAACEETKAKAGEMTQDEQDEADLIEALKGISRDGDNVCIHPIVSEYIRLPPPGPEATPSSCTARPNTLILSERKNPNRRRAQNAASAQGEEPEKEQDEKEQDEKEQDEEEQDEREQVKKDSDGVFSEERQVNPSECAAGGKQDGSPVEETTTTATVTQSPGERGESSDSPLLSDRRPLSPKARTLRGRPEENTATAHAVSPSPVKRVACLGASKSPSSGGSSGTDPKMDVGRADNAVPGLFSPSSLPRPRELSGPPSASCASPFRALPFEVVGVIDVNPTAMDVYRRNLLPPSAESPSASRRQPSQTLQSPGVPLTSTKSIDSYPASFYGAFEADLWLVSPPCQPFTRIGLQKGNADRRNASFLYLLDVLCQLPHAQRPKYLLLENVVRFEVSDTFDCLLHALECVCGYQVDVFHLNPLHFGIPNCRSRCFVTAKKSAAAPKLSNSGGLLRSALAWFRWEGSRDARKSDRRLQTLPEGKGGKAAEETQERGTSKGGKGGDESATAGQKRRNAWSFLLPQRRRGETGRAKEQGNTNGEGEGSTETGPRPAEEEDCAPVGGPKGERATSGETRGDQTAGSQRSSSASDTRQRREKETRGQGSPGEKASPDKGRGEKNSNKDVPTTGPSCLDCWTCAKCVRRRRRQDAGKQERVVLTHIPGVYASPAFFCCPIRPLEDFLDAKFPPKAPFVPAEKPGTSYRFVDEALQERSTPQRNAQAPVRAGSRRVSGRGEEVESNCEEQWEDISLAHGPSLTSELCAVDAVRRSSLPTPGPVYTAGGVFVPADVQGPWRRQTAALVLSQQQKDRIWFNVDLVRRGEKRSSCFTRSYGRTGHAQYGSLLVLDEDLALEQRWAAFAQQKVAAERLQEARGDDEEHGDGIREGEPAGKLEAHRAGKCDTKTEVRSGKTRKDREALSNKEGSQGAEAGNASRPRGEMSRDSLRTGEENGEPSCGGPEPRQVEVGDAAETQDGKRGKTKAGKEDSAEGRGQATESQEASREAGESERREREGKKGRGKKAEGTACEGAGERPVVPRAAGRRARDASECKRRGKFAWLFPRQFFSLRFFVAQSFSATVLPAKKKGNKGWELHDILPPETAVRFFSPQEILALHGFPPSFAFPDADEPRAWPSQRRMVGNSLNVHLVGMLIDFLVDDEDWN